jgi:nicotinamide-nucleotide amidase
VTIGGLGPTLDDLTKEIACEVLGVETAIDPEQDQRLRELAKRRQFTPPASFFKQAVLPTKQYGRAIPNPNGTAPGVWAENNGKIVICLPGPPFEFIPMVEQSVIPWISERNSGERTVIRSQTLRLILGGR